MIKETNHRKNYFDLDIAITHSQWLEGCVCYIVLV